MTMTSPPKLSARSLGSDTVAFAQMIASAVLEEYAGLPKTGKPQGHEHTVLAGMDRSRIAKLPTSCSQFVLCEQAL